MLTGGASPHDYLYYVTTWSGQYEAVRDRSFKLRDPLRDRTLISPTGPGGGGGGDRTALYNIELDQEAHDVSAKYPAVRARLQERLQAFRKDAADNLRGWR